MSLNINKWTLSDDKQWVTFEHEDSAGGCRHDIKVSTLLRVLKPVIAPRKAGKEVLDGGER